MSLAFVFLSHFICNGISVDDLGMLLVMVSVLIFIAGVRYRDTSVLSFIITLMIPAAYGDALFIQDATLEEGGIPASREDSPGHSSGLDDVPAIIPEEEQEENPM